MLQLVQPKTQTEFDQVRQLCWDYRDYLCALSPFDKQIVETFYPVPKYTRVLSQIEQDHTPPNGDTILALRDGQPLGCGMYHRIFPDTAEIKRVFVTNAARGTGAGCAIMQGLISSARDQGFNRIVMDTSKPLKAAQKLYLSLGFRLRGPYQDIPDIAADHLLYFEMTL